MYLPFNLTTSQRSSKSTVPDFSPTLAVAGNSFPQAQCLLKSTSPPPIIRRPRSIFSVTSTAHLKLLPQELLSLLASAAYSTVYTSGDRLSASHNQTHSLPGSTLCPLPLAPSEGRNTPGSTFLLPLYSLLLDVCLSQLCCPLTSPHECLMP